MRRLGKAGLLLAVFAALTAGTCPKRTVVVHYTPLANAGQVLGATADPGVFRIYKITSIDNNEVDAQLFHFMTSRVFLNQPNKAELLHIDRPDGTVYSSQSAEEDVAPHTTSNSVHYLVLYDAEGTKGADEWAPLRYDNSASGDSLLLVQEPAQPKPPYSAVITGAQLPN